MASDLELSQKFPVPTHPEKSQRQIDLEATLRDTPDQFIVMLVNSEWDNRKNKSISIVRQSLRGEGSVLLLFPEKQANI